MGAAEAASGQGELHGPPAAPSALVRATSVCTSPFAHAELLLPSFCWIGVVLFGACVWQHSILQRQLPPAFKPQQHGFVAGLMAWAAE